MADIKCPKCKSENWTCWDERSHVYVEESTGERFELPVGYLKCVDCGATYLSHDYAANQQGIVELGTLDEVERMDNDSYHL
jgi:hypothetical protein